MSEFNAEALSKQWETFKETNDKRLDEIVKDGEAKSETIEKLEKVEKAHDAALDENRKRLEDLESNTGDLIQKAKDEASDNDIKHRDAWLAHMGDPTNREKKQALYDAQKTVTLTTTGGGYAIPTLVGGVISTKIKNMSPMRQLARVVATPNALQRWLVADSNSASSWVGAGSARSATETPLVQAVVPTYGTVYGISTVYEEAMNDLILNVPGFLEDDISRQLASAEGTAFVTGDGSNKPTGLAGGTPEATADRPSGTSPERTFGELQYLFTGIAADFQGDRLASPLGNPGDVFLDTIYALKPEYRRNASWLMNSTVLASVRKFKDSEGNYLYRPNFQGGMGDLFGFTVHEDENVADVGSNAFPAFFGDYSQGYLIADILASLRITVDDNITSKGNVLFYSRRRLGGIVSNDDAIKVIKCATS